MAVARFTSEWISPPPLFFCVCVCVLRLGTVCPESLVTLCNLLPLCSFNPSPPIFIFLPVQPVWMKSGNTETSLLPAPSPPWDSVQGAPKSQSILHIDIIYLNWIINK